MGKLLLNLTPSEPLALVKYLSYFDDLIKLDVLLVVEIHPSVHDVINCCLFIIVRIELCRGQVLIHSSILNIGYNQRKRGILNSK
jgi:hypothetical protein